MKIKSVLACAVLLIPILAGCAGGNGGQKPAGTGSQQAPAATRPQASQTVPTTEPEPAGIPVETPFGTLFYQDRWAQSMRTEQEQTENGLRVSFFAELDGTEYPLFTVTIGAEEANAGQLTDAQGTARNVLVGLEDLGDLSGLSEEQKNYLYAIQEDINFVIQKINEKEQ